MYTLQPHLDGEESALLAPRAEQLSSRGRKMREEQGGAGQITRSLNSLCSSPRQGWEEKPPVGQA